MVASMTGMALHGGVLPVGGTFFVFSDYARRCDPPRGAVRRRTSIYFFTHDSIGLGEDGPTHQPIEQLASLRAMPGLRLIRPADANETAAAWQIAVDSDGPTALVLSRQDAPRAGRDDRRHGRRRRARRLRPRARRQGRLARPTSCSSAPAARSSTASARPGLLEADGHRRPRRLVPELGSVRRAGGRRTAMTSCRPACPRLAVEAGASFGWERYADATVSIDRFGASAPGAVNMEKFGFTADHVAERAASLLGTWTQDGRRT